MLGCFAILFVFIAFFDSGGYGLFLQKRIGQQGRPFSIFKIRTMHAKTQRISSYGKFLRNNKLDELPQLINIFLGQMSFVGPRPDIPGYYDCLQGDAKKLLELKPGLFSLAALKYYNEEAILAQEQNPSEYNEKFIFPDKVAMNMDYYHRRSFCYDMHILFLCAKRTIQIHL